MSVWDIKCSDKTVLPTSSSSDESECGEAVSRSGAVTAVGNSSEVANTADTLEI